MPNRLNIIENVPLFNGLPAEHSAELKQVALEKSYGRGETIFMDGDEGDGFYVVLAGKVKISKISFAEMRKKI